MVFALLPLNLIDIDIIVAAAAPTLNAITPSTTTTSSRVLADSSQRAEEQALDQNPKRSIACHVSITTHLASATHSTTTATKKTKRPEGEEL